MIKTDKFKTSSVPEVDFSTARRCVPIFANRSRCMWAPRKHGYLRLGFELDAEGKSILRDLDRRVPLIAQQELYFDEEMPSDAMPLHPFIRRTEC